MLLLHGPDVDHEFPSGAQDARQLGDGGGAATRRRQVVDDADGHDSVATGVAVGKAQIVAGHHLVSAAPRDAH